MPKKGGKGLTPAERQAQGEALDTKSRDFGKMLNDKGITEPSRQLISEHFTKEELNVVWKRIQALINKKDVTVREAWGALKDMGKQRTTGEKQKTLANYMLDPSGDSLAEHLITVFEEIERVKTQKRKMNKMYRGELNTIHGKAEAARLIANGTFKETEDFNGNTCYIKVTDETEMARKRTTRVSGQRHLHFS